MKLNEIRERNLDELNEELVSLRKKLFELRMNKALMKLENVSEISKTKHQIAQVMTVMREKQLQNSQG